MDEDGIEKLRAFDAIFLGAVGTPGVPDHISVWELILPIRQRFDQYVNLRPMRLLPGVSGPLAGRGAADIDMVCVRENAEGEYCGAGGRLYAGTADEVALENAVFTRRGIERIVRYGFETAAPPAAQAARQRDQVERAAPLDGALGRGGGGGARRSIPSVTLRKYHVDALAARMITASRRPWT